MKGKVKSQKLKVKSLSIVIILIISISYLLFKNLSGSLFFQHRDRINVVFYDRYPTFYSLGLEDKVDYVYSFTSNLKIMVPGGYGTYRVGALGKLAYIEKKPVLIRNAFSSATSTLINFYFYPNKDEVYYDENGNNRSLVKKIIMDSGNVNLFDRFYLLGQFLGKNSQQFTKIEGEDQIIRGDIYFQSDEFAKKYQGYFYDKTYRKEKQNVQIVYNNSYDTASSIANIIEGSGIRTVDISLKENKEKGCKIITQDSGNSETVRDLISFFDCTLVFDKTDISDIILILGEKEKEWKVK